MTDPQQPQYAPPGGQPYPPASATPWQPPRPQGGAGLGRAALIVLAAALVIDLLLSLMQASAIANPEGIGLVSLLGVLRSGTLVVLALVAIGLAVFALLRPDAPRTAPLLAIGGAATALIGVFGGFVYSAAIGLFYG